MMRPVDVSERVRVMIEVMLSSMRPPINPFIGAASGVAVQSVQILRANGSCFELHLHSRTGYIKACQPVPPYSVKRYR
jgi:hypothetical protein